MVVSNSHGRWENYTFSYEDAAGIEEITNNLIKLTVSNNNIILSGIDNETTISIYGVSGQLVYSGINTTINIPIKGIYIVRVAGQSFKVAL